MLQLPTIPPVSRLLRLFVWLLIVASACAPANALLPAATAPLPTATAPIAPSVVPTAGASVAPATAPAATVPATRLPPTAVQLTATMPEVATAESTSTPTAASASFSPAPATLTLLASGLEKPVYLTEPADGTGRLFVVEQAGLILIWRNGQFLATPFLDLRDRVNSSGNEQGLLGLAFHPQYSANRRFFVYYTNMDGNLVIARYTAQASNPDQADPTSATALLQIAHPSFQNHNGGDLVFGPDGYLYIGIGDGGSQGDPHGNGQNLDTLLAKLLRIDVNKEPYGVPPDNPFIGQADKRPEIWAYGLRNPWRFSFDRKTGDLYIADVGQDTYEEVDYQPAGSRGGANYGWSLMEGMHPYKGDYSPGLTLPVAEYTHSEGGCSITGGYVYRGAQWPQWAGLYFFGDYCTGLIWALGHTQAGWQRALVAQSSLAISSFGEDQAGEIYVLDHEGGAIYKLGVAPSS